MAIECTEQSIRLEGTWMSMRLYRDTGTARTAPLVLHLHGGAFVGGSLDAGRPVATMLAKAGAIVASAAYPLAPDCRFPEPLEVSFQALKAVYDGRVNWASRKSPVYVAGEEAGGNLAAGLALISRDRTVPPLAGQILLSPMLDPCLATMSVREAKAGPVGCRWADGWHQYLGSPDKACHPYAAPLGSSRLQGLAPALILTAQDDPLRDESLNYAARLRKAGVPVECHVLNAPTGWPGALGRSDPASATWAPALHERLVGFLNHKTSLPRETTFSGSEEA
jgi:acetyl esterase/lipase